MFFDLYKDLCDKKGVSAKKAAIEMGLSNSLPTAWKKRGLTPQGETLNKIADYFGVTTDYLLGSTQKEKTDSEKIGFDDFTYAMHSESQELTEVDKALLLSMARQLNAKKKSEQAE